MSQNEVESRKKRCGLTLERIKGEILPVCQDFISAGIGAGREAKYVLSDGTALLEYKKDKNGFYLGSTETEKTIRLYEPVRNEDGTVTGFRKMSPHLADFNRDEQILISRYAFNTKENLLANLLEVQRVMRNPQLTQIISSTCKKLSVIPDRECVRLMADVRAAYKGRHMEAARQRRKAAQKSLSLNRKKWDMER